MQVIIINDCCDDNARARQEIRVKSLLGGMPTFVKVKNEYEAAGNIVDSIDALEGKEGVVLANVAPRTKIFENGSPFGYFYYKQTLVISSVDGLTLSLVKKLGITKSIKIFPPDTIFNELGIPEKRNTQFRSYELTPRIAEALMNRKNLKTYDFSMEEIPDIPPAVWWVDNFANSKTTMTTWEKESSLRLSKWDVPYFPSLKDVPEGELALVGGSSGFKKERFLEIVIRGGQAARRLDLKSGSLIDC